MIRTRGIWTGLAACFLALLVYATVVTTRAPSARAADPSAAGAERACTRAVAQRLPGSRFPFAADVTDQGPSRWALKGTVDARVAGETVRRNYDCLIGYDRATGYRADSVHVWQSH
jgi:hypothetical protein